ncbi:RHS repeat-associated core domain-containing protein, partial [Dyella silvatica]|uniref:RHS repeat domain-containing protein n=1 Tax=Dyella silvatica TaxID=2992128 RepID=UPI002B1CCC8A
IIESTTTTVYCYDRLGRRSSKQLTVAGNTATTRYGYTAGSRLTSLTYPSGAQVSYTRNSNGQITAVSLTPAGGGSAVSLVSNVSYQPFGPVSSYTLGSGQTITRSFDANGQLSGVTSPALNLQWSRDAAGNINTLSGANSESYAYDPLQRLTGINDPTGKAIEAYTYSKTGDRLSKTGGLFATGTYAYASGTHHLLSTGAAARTYDAAGNTVTNQLGADQYIYRYNARNRLESVNRDGQDVASYTYDANGQRVRKTASFPSAIDMRFGYDEASRLLTEQSASGSRDYVWLGELPIAAIDNTGTSSTVNYVHADGLGTPRAVTNATGTTLWQWSYAGNAFGEQQPTSASGYAFNLRFPGQYFDAESGISDNINRGYDAATGRYVESDPIGLSGGVSTYAAVGNGPLSGVDPLGLATDVWIMYHPIPLTLGANHEFIVFKDTNSTQGYVLRAGPSGSYPSEYAPFNSSATDPATNKDMYIQATFSTWEKSQESMSHDNHNLLGSDVILPDDISVVIKEAQDIASTFNKAQITYRAKTTNSNAFANAAYYAITGRLPSNQDSAPGHGTRLPVNLLQCH